MIRPSVGKGEGPTLHHHSVLPVCSLTWVTPVFVHNDKVCYTVGATGLNQLGHHKISSVQSLGIWKDKPQFLQWME